MFTVTIHTALVNFAANGWINAGISTARLSSDPRAGLIVFLTAFQNGICAFCGVDSDNMELCHIVPGGKARLGWLAGNIGMGCRACNEIDADNIVAYSTIKRPDLIAIAWPTIPELSRMGKAEKVERENVRELKRAIRGMK